MIPDPAALPFPTHGNDWFVCICPEQNEIVFIENALVARIMNEKGENVNENPEPLPDGSPGWVHLFDMKFHAYAVELGFRIARWLHAAKPERANGAAYKLKLALVTLEFHVGFFSSQTYAFLARK